MGYDYDENDILWASLKLRHLIKAKLQNELKSHDITLDQWIILNMLSKNEGSNQKKLAEVSYKYRTVITRILKILEDKGLIERKKSYHDKRESLVYLTNKGKNLYKETSVIMHQNAQEINNYFTDDKREEFKSLLNELIFKLK